MTTPSFDKASRQKPLTMEPPSIDEVSEDSITLEKILESIRSAEETDVDDNDHV